MRPEIPRTLAEKVDPRRAALIVVDIQNDYCATGGFFSQRGSDVSPIQEMVPRLERFIAEARRVQLPIIYVKSTHDEQNGSASWLEQRSRRANNRESCVAGTWGEEFYRLEPRPGEVIVQKHRYSAFVGTSMNLILRSMGIETVIVTGVGTRVCVESTARDAFENDYYLVLLEDCTGSSNKEAHLSTLKNIGGFFGVVVSSDDVFAAWHESGAYTRASSP